MELIDLTRPIVHRGLTYPGTVVGAALEQTKPSDDAPWKASRFTTLDLHYGTHIDAPLHFLENGSDIMSIGLCVGEAVVIRDGGPALTVPADTGPRIGPENIILFSTGWEHRAVTRAYYRGHPYLSDSAARLLARRRVAAVGTDAPSPDSPDSATFPVHRTLLPAGIPIVEGLVQVEQLYRLQEGGKTFYVLAVPLNIRDGEASPARVVAVVCDDLHTGTLTNLARACRRDGAGAG
jgi:arylformamidase